MYAAALNITVKFETSVKPTALLNLDIEYQNADLWGLWGGGVRMHPVHPPAYGPGYILGKQSDLPFSRKEKSVGSFTHEQNIICSHMPKPNTVG